MFKSKKNRDSVLLIFMALVTVVFLLYIFFPSGQKDEEKKIPVKKEIERSDLGIKIENENKAENEFFGLREILKKYFNEINTGDRSINLIPAEELESELRSALKGRYASETGRALKYRFRDINRAVDIFKDSEIPAEEKFDIYLALFLIRSAEEDIIARSINFTSDDLISLIDLNSYNLINNEAAENYQTIPIVIYADMLVKKSDIFSPGKEIAFFSKALEPVGDISPMQHINSIKDLFSISTELRKFSFSWVERDVFDPDDKGTYKNITVRRRSFFKLQFLVFPDPGKGGDHTWLTDLLNSDSGSIELADLKVIDETPGENYSAKSIMFTESTSRFIIIMDSPAFVSERGYIALMVKEKMNRIRSANKVIVFAEKLYSKKEFRKKMETFGKFLYMIRSVF